MECAARWPWTRVDAATLDTISHAHGETQSDLDALIDVRWSILRHVEGCGSNAS